MDLFSLFRIISASLAGGYAAYLVGRLVRRWMSLSEHKKDTLYVVSRYWGALRPGSVFGALLLVCLMTALVGFLLFPEQLARLAGGEQLLKWIRTAFPGVR